MSYVYAVQQGDDGPIKIGYTTNPRARFSTLRNGSPYVLKIRMLIEGDLQDEAGWLNDFSPDRLRGEWFKPTPRLLKALSQRGYVTSLPPHKNQKPKPEWMGGTATKTGRACELEEARCGRCDGWGYNGAEDECRACRGSGEQC